MKIALPAFILLMTLMPLNGNAAVDAHIEKILAFCVTKWPNDFPSQMRCSERGAKTYRSVQTMLERFPRKSKQRLFIQRCALKWKTPDGGYDWPKVYNCADLKLQRNP